MDILAVLFDFPSHDQPPVLLGISFCIPISLVPLILDISEEDVRTVEVDNGNLEEEEKEEEEEEEGEEEEEEEEEEEDEEEEEEEEEEEGDEEAKAEEEEAAEEGTEEEDEKIAVEILIDGRESIASPNRPANP